MDILLIICLFIIVCLSVIQFVFYRYHSRKQPVALEVFVSLCFIYCIAIIGFAFIYFLLAKRFIITTNEMFYYLSFGQQVVECIYFSGVTMLTIGYGDISPLGIGRMFALLQAIIGYILPTAFVLKLMQRSAK